MSDVPLIDSTSGLEDVVARARDLEAVALDTEFVWERTYYAGLGLVQVGLGGEDIALLDTTAIPDLAALGALLEDAGVQKVLHDAAQDLQILARATRSQPVNAFDTQRAAGLVGLSATLSLQDLVEWAVGVRLEKGETRSDWLRRPLTDSQLGYAAADVRYLLDARRKILDEAEARDRAGWVASEMERYDDPALYDEADPDDAVDRVKGRGLGRMSGRQRAVLRAVAAWREREARALDRTRRMVLPDEALVAVAERGPQSGDDLRRLKLTDRQIGRYGDGLLAAVEAGVDAEPEHVARRGRPGPEDQRRAARLLVAQGFLAGRCEREGVDSVLVATKSQLADLVEAGPDAVADAFPGWRYDFVGRDLEALLRGDLAVGLEGPDGWPVATPPAAGR
ncbi:HRDC domain-containing protein [Rubrivirga sp. S365]|uniref:HRDC domain-containing protein n=1 Tax=Rubrivirga litoralis TaxID=3075598 RepID=A0ABU3BTD2_9BACT|nr:MULTISPECIES: HRDC domain-containing protein [unclassified Rubrivirga]MDT0632528.1 HRDC domain-containing protein [Rubrivirga sp. F394]MDT7856993.1 HRDC domain-containing protein [Rubrivirga sp. S365]